MEISRQLVSIKNHSLFTTPSAVISRPVYNDSYDSLPYFAVFFKENFHGHTVMGTDVLRGHGLLQQFNVVLEITPQRKSEMNTQSNDL